MRELVDKRIAERSPGDSKSKASRRSRARRSAFAASKVDGLGSTGHQSYQQSPNKSIADETIFDSIGEGLSASQQYGMTGAHLTLNKSLIGKLSQKMEAKTFSTDYAKAEKTLQLLGADKYDSCEDIAMLQLQVEQTMERTRT